MKQKTILRPVAIEGAGLQTGSKVRLVLNTAPADSGINFLRADMPGKPAVAVKDVTLSGCTASRRTVLKKGNVEIHTTEHLLAAMYALGIDNAQIEVYGKELPALDGSAKEYLEAIERAGVVEQDAPVKELIPDKEVGVSNKDKFLTAFPYKNLRISYFLSYPVKSIGEQFLSIDITPENFEKEIAPARTFCMAKEAFILRLLGFGRGADNKNTLIMGKNGPVGNELRFSDEPVRHKILDLIGDLSLVGMPLKAHIVAVKSGHSLNLELVKKLKGEYNG